jgi:hypothetical protein
MARAYAAQEEVIAALPSNGNHDLVERLEDCTTTRLLRLRPKRRCCWNSELD